MISIIIPAWHEEGTIDMTLYALNKSNYALNEIEVIVVASSDDNTYNLAVKAKRNLSFRKYAVIKQKNGGKNSALLQGFERSIGEIIIFLDADAIVDKEWLNELVRPIKLKKAVCTNGNFSPLKISWITDYHLITKIWIKEVLGINSTNGAAGIAIRRDIIGKIGAKVLLNPDVYSGVDHYLGEQLLKRGYLTYFSKKAKIRTFLSYTFRGFIKESFRWKKGYSLLISEFNLAKILVFNLAISLSVPLFLVSFFSFPAASIPFIAYLLFILFQCLSVSVKDKNFEYAFYIPIYLFLDFIARNITIISFIKTICSRNKSNLHFKGER